MIKANELRIGNWVYTQSTKLVKDKTLPVQIRVVTKQEEHKYDPIPLTAEILEKCGFKRSGYEMLFWNKNHVSLAGINWADDNIPEYQFLNFGYSEKGIISIHFLHQLQNLYFALTGEELPIQL